MKVSSNKYRFYVYDIKNKKILKNGLVAHGMGSEIAGSDSLKFSNTPNSYCTSLGKYRIGKSYYGSFGKSYKLHGLDATNSKAYERAIVLHKYGTIPDTETEEPIDLSLGCPMVSSNFFNYISKEIDNRNKKSILLWIYY